MSEDKAIFTLVVEFDREKAPVFGHESQVMGGKLLSVCFDDMRGSANKDAVAVLREIAWSGELPLHLQIMADEALCGLKPS